MLSQRKPGSPPDDDDECTSYDDSYRQNNVGRFDKLIFVKEISEPGSFCQEAVEDYLVVEMALLGGALLPCHNYIR